MQLSDDDVARVADAIRTAEAATIAPRFGALAAGDIAEKTPGDVVTIADHECEALLVDALRTIDDVPVVGEEGVAADHAVLGHLRSGDCWLVDPLDGTKNFAKGWTGYAVMVARVVEGRSVASWIWIPHRDQMAIARADAGAVINDAPIRMAPGDPDPATWSAVIRTRYVPEADRPPVERFRDGVGTPVGGVGCAGIEYVDLVTGAVDLLFYWRTHPWDHAPGSLLAVEAGAGALRPDGSDYRPDDDRRGLLVSATADEAARRFRAALAG
ncbi:MAG: inositol monophosphatase family protein [Actinomycetota bacterium]